MVIQSACFHVLRPASQGRAGALARSGIHMDANVEASRVIIFRIIGINSHDGTSEVGINYIGNATPTTVMDVFIPTNAATNNYGGKKYCAITTFYFYTKEH